MTRADAQKQAYEQWRAQPNPETESAVMVSMEPVIQSGLMSFAQGDQQYLTRGRILARQALDSYDPRSGAALNTHVYHQLQRLQRYRAERQSALHTPESVRLTAGAVRRYTADFQAQHGREPSQSEIGEALRISPRMLQKTMLGGESALESMSGEKSDLPGVHNRSAADAWMDYVYHDLRPTDKLIFEGSTGYNGAQVRKKSEIAKALGISAPAVSQRITKISQQLSEVPL